MKESVQRIQNLLRVSSLNQVERKRLVKESLQPIPRLLRVLGLLNQVEKVRYITAVMASYRKNAVFCRDNPGFAVPPKHLAYDAYNRLDWSFYKTSGEQTAIYFAGIIKNYEKQTESAPLNILEWGCGPGRVVRHLPSLFGSRGQIYGTDYNAETVHWCKKNIPQVHFEINGLYPPLNFEDERFDAVYAISVFTHLSEEIGRLWINELERITASKGLIVFTVNGDSLKRYLLPDELAKYESYGFVERSNYQEGKKWFSTFHSPQYVAKSFLTHMEVLEHRTDGFYANIQDVWIARKRD